MTRAEVVATLALIVSILSLAVNLWNVWRDRPRLLIQIYRGQHDMVIEIINRGRKSTAIERPVHLKFFMGHSYPLTDDRYYPNWPAGGKLAEAEKATVRYPREDWKQLHQRYLSPPTLMGILVVDIADGRHYRRLPVEVQRWMSKAVRQDDD
jgi:hypothetical protein